MESLARPLLFSSSQCKPFLSKTEEECCWVREAGDSNNYTFNKILTIFSRALWDQEFVLLFPTSQMFDLQMKFAPTRVKIVSWSCIFMATIRNQNSICECRFQQPYGCLCCLLNFKTSDVNSTRFDSLDLTKRVS